jgi:hypothetical protein
MSRLLRNVRSYSTWCHIPEDGILLKKIVSILYFLTTLMPPSNLILGVTGPSYGNGKKWRI